MAHKEYFSDKWVEQMSHFLSEGHNEKKGQCCCDRTYQGYVFDK